MLKVGKAVKETWLIFDQNYIVWQFDFIMLSWVLKQERIWQPPAHKHTDTTFVSDLFWSPGWLCQCFKHHITPTGNYIKQVGIGNIFLFGGSINVYISVTEFCHFGALSQM